MSSMTQFLALSGIAFVGIEMWKRSRGASSLDAYKEARAKPTQRAVPSAYLGVLAGGEAAPRMLNVNNFGREHLEGKQAPPN